MSVNNLMRFIKSGWDVFVHLENVAREKLIFRILSLMSIQ